MAACTAAVHTRCLRLHPGFDVQCRIVDRRRPATRLRGGVLPTNPMVISEVRRRLLLVIDKSRRAAVARQARVDAAASAYERFLTDVAIPVFQMIGNSLRAEGYAFSVFTPAGGLRLASTRTAEDYIELALDTSTEQPIVVARVSRARGRQVVSHESPLLDGTPVDALRQEDVLSCLLREIEPFVER